MTLRALLLAAALTTTAAFAQEFRMTCQDDNNWNGDRTVKECVTKDFTLPARTQLNVNASRNGGIVVRGYDGAEIKVRAKLEAWAETAAAAKAQVARLQVVTSGPVITVAGDDPTAEKQSYAVSFEVYVPRHIDVDLNSYNGPISLKAVDGRLRFKTHNGPLNVSDLAGDVEGSTHNGPINVVLTGNTWRGQKLDLSTHNGPLAVKLPTNYSAQFETSHNWGPLSVNYPLTNKSDDKKQIVATLGSGGPLVRITTHNGPVSISETPGN